MSEKDGDGGGVPLTEVSIQDAIRDRKAERKLKAEQKRKADLQRIRDMRSTTGIDPLQRFPKELWVKIFYELDPEDRGNAWEVHPLFRDLLEKTRVRDILFPQILQVDAFQTTIRQTLQGRWNGRLRCISKRIRGSNDRWIEKSFRKRIQENQANSSSLELDAVNLCCSDITLTDEPHMLKMLLRSFVEEEETSGKLFFPRALTVSFCDEEMDGSQDRIQDIIEQYKTDVTALLTRIGGHIWHFKFFMEELLNVNYSFCDVYLLLQDWISRMPNLRWLEVMIRPPYQMIDDTNGAHQMSEAESTLRKYPFPHLPHLERLSFHSSYQSWRKGSGRLHNIYEVILGANQHIKMLNLDDGDRDSADDLILFPPHLTESLQLTRFTVCDEDWGFRHVFSCLQRIRPVINFKWPLKTLVLGVCSDQEGESLSSVFRFLRRFPTLETLKLKRLDDFSIGNTDKYGYLELPNLEEFEMELTSPEIDYESNIHFFFSLQFLVNCGKLKRLSWTLTGFDDSKLREHLKRFENWSFGKMIDFRAGLRYLYDSNIWCVFPRLDSIEYKIRKDKNERSHSCRDVYLRFDSESMTIQKFLKRHCCSRYNELKSCIL